MSPLGANAATGIILLFEAAGHLRRRRYPVDGDAAVQRMRFKLPVRNVSKANAEVTLGSGDSDRAGRVLALLSHRITPLSTTDLSSAAVRVISGAVDALHELAPRISSSFENLQGSVLTMRPRSIDADPSHLAGCLSVMPERQAYAHLSRGREAKAAQKEHRTHQTHPPSHCPLNRWR